MVTIADIMCKSILNDLRIQVSFKFLSADRTKTGISIRESFPALITISKYEKKLTQSYKFREVTYLTAECYGAYIHVHCRTVLHVLV